MLFTLCFVHLNETFTGDTPTGWQSSNPKANISIQTCHASHPIAPARCLTAGPFTEADLRLLFNTPFSTYPLFAFFTLRGTPHTKSAEIGVQFDTLLGPFISIGMVFHGEFPTWWINTTSSLANGTLFHDQYLTHSFAFVVKEPSNYTFYVDGMPYAAGTLDKSVPLIEGMTLRIITTDGTAEVGNVFIGSTDENRWPLTIERLLQYRVTERSAYFGRKTDSSRRRTSKGFSKEKIDDSGEDKASLSVQVDPRRFQFPLTIDNSKSHSTDK